jgi:hypothetical protein
MKSDKWGRSADLKTVSFGLLRSSVSGHVNIAGAATRCIYPYCTTCFDPWGWVGTINI